MSYELHITRATEWFESEQHPIPRDEWEAFARRHPSIWEKGVIFQMDEVAFVVETDEICATMYWNEGRVSVTNATAPQILLDLADALDANLIGDDGERYLADGRVDQGGVPSHPEPAPPPARRRQR